jgi:hypothetical protein
MFDHLGQLILPKQNLLDGDTFFNHGKEIKESHFFVTLSYDLAAELFDISKSDLIHFSGETQYFSVNLSLLGTYEFLLSKNAGGIDNG